jgi:hypothetical protein
MVTNIVRELGIKPFLDHIYAAYDLNMEKPDLEVFKFVIKDTGVDPSEIISIGDSEKKDIIPARKCGMETIHIKEQSQIYELGKAVEALEEKKRASIKAREEKALSEEHYLEASLLRASHEELRGYPVNMHIDLTTIPRNGLTEAQQMEQLGQNMDTIARIIAWHHTFGFDIRYALEHDTDSVYRDRALSILKDSLMKLGSIPGINVDELLLHISQPHAGDRVVEVALKNLEAIKTMQAIPDKTYCVAIKDNVEKTGVAIPNYTAAANMGLSLAALRVAKEKEKRGYNELRDKILRTFRDIYKKCGIINEENGFTADELDLMVAGSSDTRLYYTILYALPPIMRAAVEELKKYHESLHLLLQAA